MPDYSYVGSGKAYIREVGAALPLAEVGNASKLDFNINESSKSSPDYTQAGGGTYNEIKRVDSMELVLTLNELSPANLAKGVFGSLSSIASAAVTGEALTVYPLGMSPFANMPLGSVAPTVTAPNGSAAARANTTVYGLNAYITPVSANGYYYKATVAGTSGASIPTYPTTIGATVTDGTVTWTCAGKTAPVAGTDYEVRGGGIYVFNTLAGEAWTVNYTKAQVDVIDALTTSSKEYELFFDGLNEARSGKKANVKVYRVKLGAAKVVSWIGDDYGVIELSGKVLKDTSKTGAGVSQYFKASLEA